MRGREKERKREADITHKTLEKLFPANKNRGTNIVIEILI